MSMCACAFVRVGVFYNQKGCGLAGKRRFLWVMISDGVYPRVLLCFIMCSINCAQ